MMEKITEIPNNLRVGGIALALAALLIAALAIASAANPINAQDADDGPQPCGPGQQDPPEDPDPTVSRGHYAVFDGYWDSSSNTLNPNLCPPSVVHMLVTTHKNPDTGEETQEEVSTRTSSNIDIRQTVIHIDDVFAYTLTAEDVETYDFFKTGVDTTTSQGVTQDTAVGQTVWWLMAEEEEEDETEPEFNMGFSAALFDTSSWYLADGTDKGAKPLQYEFEVIREPGIPVDEQGHLFAFDEPPELDSGEEDTYVKTADWDSSEVDANALALYPGDYYHYQWAFTRPGTYIVSVQLKGQVRTAEDGPPTDAAPDWKPISDKNVETSEVMQYVFQVGPLTLNEEPAFEVERSVEEHSASDTPVGAPIPVYQGDDDDLSFALTGPGHSLFSVDANGQIKVAGDLDYEVRSEYRLTLSVRDNKDHERNTDALVDNSISVRINVTDQPEAERSVAENSEGGALVGAPVEVTDAGANTLSYSLSGHGHSRFSVERVSTSTDAQFGNAQIRVADQAGLDYEVRSTYHLTLNVTGYTDPLDDYTIRVTVTVTDVDETDVAEAGNFDHGLTIVASATQLAVGETVNLRASIGDLPEGATNTRVGWGTRQPDNSGHAEATGQRYHKSDSYDTPGARTYQIRFLYDDGSGQSPLFYSPWITITWQ